MTDEFYSCWFQKLLPDGRTVEVVSLTFGRARIVAWRWFGTIDDLW